MSRRFINWSLCLLVGVSQIFIWGWISRHMSTRVISLEEDIFQVVPEMQAFKLPEAPQWHFKNFSLNDWRTSQNLSLEREDNAFFKEISPDLECFLEGTDWTKTKDIKCICRESYFGKDCGIPSSVWHGHFISNPGEVKSLVRRKSPRRLIQGVLFNHEFEMLELRLSTLHDVVDAFVIQESNYTTIGDPKALHLLSNLAKGWMHDYQEKILYVPLLFFLKEWESDGWLVENSIRNHLSTQGLSLLQNQSDDDIFLLFDADEVPNRDALLFLKLYDGYSEPIRFGLRWNLYGFFWLKASESSEDLLLIYSGATLGMLRDIYDNKAILLRKNDYGRGVYKSKVEDYKVNHRLRTLTIGDIGSYAGFHCSWCFRPEGIRTKLLSAQKEDKPRWGDYPEKTKLPYIASLIKSGAWFDGSSPTLKVNSNDPNFAPKYALTHRNTFKHLLSL